jgi:hypothetical protein
MAEDLKAVVSDQWSKLEVESSNFSLSYLTKYQAKA